MYLEVLITHLAHTKKIVNIGFQVLSIQPNNYSNSTIIKVYPVKNKQSEDDNMVNIVFKFWFANFVFS